MGCLPVALAALEKMGRLGFADDVESVDSIRKELHMLTSILETTCGARERLALKSSAGEAKWMRIYPPTSEQGLSRLVLSFMEVPTYHCPYILSQDGVASFAIHLPSPHLPCRPL